MSERALSPDDLLLFLIGRPGSGKSTFARYLTRAIISTNVLCLNDYELLVAQSKKLSPSQIRWEPNGQFEVLDRTIFDGLFDQLVKPIDTHRGKRPIIIEFSRSSYVKTFGRLSTLGNTPFCIVYLDTPLETCIQRNAIRASFYPINTTPVSVIRNYLSEDDLSTLQTAYPGRVRVVQNEATSLHALEREASLLLEDLVGTEHVKSLRSSRHLARELAIAGLLTLYLVAFLSISAFTWRAGPSSLLASLLPDPSQLQFLKTILYVCAAGGLGSTTYCIRALYHYYILGTFDFAPFTC